MHQQDIRQQSNPPTHTHPTTSSTYQQQPFQAPQHLHSPHHQMARPNPQQQQYQSTQAQAPPPPQYVPPVPPYPQHQVGRHPQHQVLGQPQQHLSYVEHHHHHPPFPGQHLSPVETYNGHHYQQQHNQVPYTLPQSDGLLNDSTGSSNPEQASREDEVARGFEDKINATKQKQQTPLKQKDETLDKEIKDEEAVAAGESSDSQVKSKVPETDDNSHNQDDEVKASEAVKEEKKPENSLEESAPENNVAKAEIPEPPPQEDQKPPPNQEEAPNPKSDQEDQDETMLSDDVDDQAGEKVGPDENDKAKSLGFIQPSESGASNLGKAMEVLSMYSM